MTDTINKNTYLKTKIYKIVDISDTEKYIGSTYDTLSSRMSKHRYDYRRYKKGECHYISVFDLFDNYGSENCKIELIEHYPCETIHEQRKREGYHIQNEECINKSIAGRDRKQYKQDNIEVLRKKGKEYRQANIEVLREKGKLYREKHVDEIKDQRNKYYIRNKDTILAKNRQYNNEHAREIAASKKKYYLDNLDTIREYKKTWHIENRDRLMEKKQIYSKLKVICCHCQTEISKPNIAQHQKSKYCQSFQNKNNNIKN